MLVGELRSELVGWVADRMTLERVVVVTGCEDLEQVDTIVEVRLELLEAEAYFMWSEFEVVEAEVAEGLV